MDLLNIVMMIRRIAEIILSVRYEEFQGRCWIDVLCFRVEGFKQAAGGRRSRGNICTLSSNFNGSVPCRVTSTAAPHQPLAGTPVALLWRCTLSRLGKRQMIPEFLWQTDGNRHWIVQLTAWMAVVSLAMLRLYCRVRLLFTQSESESRKSI